MPHLLRLVLLAIFLTYLVRLRKISSTGRLGFSVENATEIYAKQLLQRLQTMCTFRLHIKQHLDSDLRIFRLTVQGPHSYVPFCKRASCTDFMAIGMGQRLSKAPVQGPRAAGSEETNYELTEVAMKIMQRQSDECKANLSFFLNRILCTRLYQTRRGRIQNPRLVGQGRLLIARKMDSNSTCLYAVITEVDTLFYVPNGAISRHIKYTGWSKMSMFTSGWQKDLFFYPFATAALQLCDAMNE